MFCSQFGNLLNNIFYYNLLNQFQVYWNLKLIDGAFRVLRARLPDAKLAARLNLRAFRVKEKG